MDDMFDYDAPKTFVNLYEMANANDDGADKFFGNFVKLNNLCCVKRH